MTQASPPVPATTGSGADSASGSLRLLLGWVTLFVVGTDLFVIGPLLPEIGRQYSVGTGRTGLLITGFSVAYIVFGPIFGNLSDRLDRRTMLIGGIAVFAAANLATAFAPDYWSLLVSRVVAGGAAAAVTPSIYALVGALAPAAKRGTWLSIANSGLVSALWAGAPLGDLMARRIGWQDVFVVLAGTTLVMGLIGLKGWPKVVAAAQVSQRSGLASRLRFVLVTALWAIAIYGLYTYLATYLGSIGHRDSLPLVLVAYGIGAVAGGLVGGRVADRFGGRRAVVATLLGVAVTETVVLLCLHAPIAVFSLSLAVFAFVGYATFPAQQKRIVDAFGGQSGSVLAWNNSMLYLGMSIAAAGGGVILGVADYRTVLVIGIAAAIVGALDLALFDKSPTSRVA